MLPNEGHHSSRVCIPLRWVYESSKNSLESAYISQSAFDAICDLSATFSKQGVKVFELAGRKRIKLDQYVGIIETACGTRIEILPKHIVVGEEQK